MALIAAPWHLYGVSLLREGGCRRTARTTAGWSVARDYARAGNRRGQQAEALVDAQLPRHRAGQWRSWNFLTLQIQIAAGQWRPSTTAEGPTGDQPSDGRREEAPSDWKVIKSRIREPIPESLF
jgi:hypothetical protein